jgi:hypothetical protein
LKKKLKKGERKLLQHFLDFPTKNLVIFEVGKALAQVVTDCASILK